MRSFEPNKRKGRSSSPQPSQPTTTSHKEDLINIDLLDDHKDIDESKDRRTKHKGDDLTMLVMRWFWRLLDDPCGTQQEQQRQHGSSSSSKGTVRRKPSMKRYILPFFGGFALLQAWWMLSLSFRVTSDESVYSASASSGHYASLLSLHQNPESVRKCVVVGMMSQHMDENQEASVRDWHRLELHKFLNDRSIMVSSMLASTTTTIPRIHLRFAVPIVNSKDSIKNRLFGGTEHDADWTEKLRLLRREDSQYKDIVELQSTPALWETERRIEFTTGATFEMMHALQDLVQDDDCSEAFFVRAQTNYLIDWQGLVDTIEYMPTFMNYFGTIVTDYPTPHVQERREGAFSQSFFPRFALGGFYGMSRDTLEELLLPTTERTVNRVKDPNGDDSYHDGSGYTFPHQDQAVGLALHRSLAQTKNQFYAKGIHHLCSTINIDCRNYQHNVAFAISAEEWFTSPTMVLQTARLKLNQCRALHLENKSPPFFKVDRVHSGIDTKQIISTSCTILSEEGKALVSKMEEQLFAAKAQTLDDDSCAEEMYLLDNPQVAMAVESGLYKSGRDHYVQQGYKDGGKNFFCPKQCQGRSPASCIDACDKEDNYLLHYPEIKSEIDSGIIGTAREHYERKGRKEGRAWNCLPRHNDGAVGDKEGCKSLWEKFITNTEKVVQNWPIHGITNDLPEDRCKALLLIDGGGGDGRKFLDYTLRVHRRYLGPDWMFYLVGPPSVARSWRYKYRGPMVEVVDLPPQFADLSDPHKASALYRSKWLWNETIKCEYVLNTHRDALMLRPGAEDFLHYSYAGTPVEPASYKTKEWRRLCVKSSRCGGEGGLSLRRKSYTMRALDFCQASLDDSEDLWYVTCLQALGDSSYMPHPTELNRFSLGDLCEADDPVGMFQSWKSCKASTCAHALASSQLYRDAYGVNHTALEACSEGEYFYHHQYKDHNAMFPSAFNPGWEHWFKVGRNEGRPYPCFTPLASS